MGFETYDVDVELPNYQLTEIKENYQLTEIKEKSYEIMYFILKVKKIVVDFLHDNPEGYFGCVKTLIVHYFVKDLLSKKDRLQLH